MGKKARCSICGFDVDLDGFEFVEQKIFLHRFPGTKTLVNTSYAHAECFLGIEKEIKEDEPNNKKDSQRDVIDGKQDGDESKGSANSSE